MLPDSRQVQFHCSSFTVREAPPQHAYEDTRTQKQSPFAKAEQLGSSQKELDLVFQPNPVFSSCPIAPAGTSLRKQKPTPAKIRQTLATTANSPSVVSPALEVSVTVISHNLAVMTN